MVLALLKVNSGVIRIKDTPKIMRSYSAAPSGDLIVIFKARPGALSSRPSGRAMARFRTSASGDPEPHTGAPHYRNIKDGPLWIISALKSPWNDAVRALS